MLQAPVTPIPVSFVFKYWLSIKALCIQIEINVFLIIGIECIVYLHFREQVFCNIVINL